jgi:hypothetical protein
VITRSMTPVSTVNQSPMRSRKSMTQTPQLSQWQQCLPASPKSGSRNAKEHRAIHGSDAAGKT